MDNAKTLRLHDAICHKNASKVYDALNAWLCVMMTRICFWVYTCKTKLSFFSIESIYLFFELLLSIVFIIYYVYQINVAYSQTILLGQS